MHPLGLFPSSLCKDYRRFGLLRKQTTAQQTRPLCLRPVPKVIAYRKHNDSAKPMLMKPSVSIPSREGSWVCHAAEENVKTEPTLLGWIIRRIVVCFFSVALVIGLFIAVLPTLISTPFGLGAATMGANVFMPGVLEVQKVSAGWKKPIQVEGIVIKDGIKKLVPVVQVERVTTSRTLWDIVKGNRFEVFVLGPTVNAFPDEVGTIPVVRFAQKTGVLMKQDRQADASQASTSAVPDSKKHSVVRTKRFEEWMANTAKKPKKEPKPSARTFEQTHINMTAELRSMGTSILVNNGKLLVTREVRSLVGDYMHWIFAHGSADVVTISEDLNLKTDWTKDYDDMKRDDDEEAEPVLLNVDSPNISGDLRGWKVQKALELQRPGKASVTLTPAFSRECLAVLNPLLANMVGVKSGSKVAVELTTKTMSLPASIVDIHIQPIRLTAGSAPFWDSLLNLLRVKDRGPSRGQALQVWTSAVDCSIIDNEIARCSRCDMLLGHPNRGVHVVVWGDCTLDNETLKMWLGIPADTLLRIGYKNLRSDYILPIPLKGTVDNPFVDWDGAADDIGKLAFSQLVGDAPDDEIEGYEGHWSTKLLTSAKKKVMQSKKKQPDSSIPVLKNPLPWQDNTQEP